MPKSAPPKFIFCFALLIFCTNILVTAQDTEVETVAVPVARSIVSVEKKDEKEDEKGSIVRGRVTYRDSGVPVRRGWIGFRKIKELVEPPKTEAKEGFALVSPYSSGADGYVLTNDQGEFEMKNVKAGIYQPFLKVQGVLNPDFSDRENPLFQQITIDGVSEIQTSIGVVRGAAVSGKISYADGSPVIGAKVQVFAKSDRVIRSYSYSDDIKMTTTDDLGYYRLSGLPAGDYFVRVVEPSLPVKTGEAKRSYNLPDTSNSSDLKTYYPSSNNQKDSTPVQLFLGRDQTDINISIPERRLFTISGMVVAKTNKSPLKGITVTFTKINEDSILEYDGGQNRQLKTDETGIWKFEDLPKGKYRVRATTESEYTYENGKSVVKSPPIKYAPSAKIVDLEDNNAENISLELGTEATISGIIFDEEGNNLSNRYYISAIGKDFNNNASGGIDPNSLSKTGDKRRLPFTIAGVSEGEYYLTLNTNDDFYVKSIKFGDKDLLRESLKVEAGDKIEKVEVVLSNKIGTVKGKISNLDEKDRSTSFVVLIPADSAGMLSFATARQTGILNNGEFKIKTAPGEYFIFVATPKNRPNLGNLEKWLEEMRAKSEKVTVRLNQTTDINLSYPNE